MQPKSNIPIYSENGTANSSSQQYRTSSLAALNSNLVVTQQQQPNRSTNQSSYQLNSNSVNDANNLELVKRVAAMMQQHQQQNNHSQVQNQQQQLIINRSTPPSSSGVPVNNQTPIILDRNQQIPSMLQAICLLSKLDKSKSTNQSTEMHTNNNNSLPLNSQVLLTNQTTNVPTISINTSLPSTSLNQTNQTVYTMNFAEAYSRLNAQNKNNLTPDEIAQFNNALSKHQNQTNNNNNSSFMVINNSNQKPSINNQLLQNVILECNSLKNSNSDKSNIYMKNQNILKNSNIPIWNLFDQMSNNENTIDRTLKTSQSKINVDMNHHRQPTTSSSSSIQSNHKLAPLSSVSISSSITKNNPNINASLQQKQVTASLPREWDNIINSQHTNFKQNQNTRPNVIHNNSASTISTPTAANKPHTPQLDTVTHQILRDSKETSILLSNNITNCHFNNDDMVNQHFKKSLSNISDHNISNNVVNPHILSKNNTNDLKNTSSTKKKTSLIDLEIPDNMVPENKPKLMNINVNDTDLYMRMNNNNQMFSQYSIKQKAESLVDDLLNQNSNVRLAKSNSQTFNSTNNTGNFRNIIPNSNNNSNNNSTLGSLKSTNVNRREQPSKSDLPLKKRIMLDFNVNDQSNDDDVAVKQETSSASYNINQSSMENSTSNATNIINASTTTTNNNKTGKRKRQRTTSIDDNASSIATNEESENCDYHQSDSGASSSLAPKKRRGRIPGTGKNQKLKQENKQKEISRLSSSGCEDNWKDLTDAINHPPDIGRLSNRTLNDLDLEPLKLSKKAFFQIGSCNEIAPRMVKCRSCRQNNATTTSGHTNEIVGGGDDGASSIKSGKSGKDQPNQTDNGPQMTVSSFCRFHGFRKLQYSQKGSITQAGFCRSSEADELDLSLWRMHWPLQSDISVTAAIYMLENLSGIFCEIVETENQFIRDSYIDNNAATTNNDDSNNPASKRTTNRRGNNAPSNTTITQNDSDLYNGLVWKRPVLGVREMCDVCETSIFNTHWACRKCGYSVCVDCFTERTESKPNSTSNSTNTNNNMSSSASTASSCEGTTTGAGDDHPPHHNHLSSTSNSTRTGAYKNRYYSNNHSWSVCTANRQSHNPDQLLKVELIPARIINELCNRMHTICQLINIKSRCNCATAQLKQEVAVLQSSQKSAANQLTTHCDTHLYLLADCALKDEEKSVSVGSGAGSVVSMAPVPSGGASQATLRPPPVLSPPHQLEYPTPTNPHQSNNAVWSWMSVASKIKILHLTDAQHPDNFKLFQNEWYHQRPIIVSGCHKMMSQDLWTPAQFLEDFENETVMLVDCETSLPVPKGTMRSFWEGFECIEKRISADHRPVPSANNTANSSFNSTNENSNLSQSNQSGSAKPSSSNGKRPTACLKLKDWPPSDDFNDLLPTRCHDILANLPIPQYTGRNGHYNLAGHLLDFFVRPDLGPKLYNAYGMPSESRAGTTNLHMDIADAVNVMLYVGVPADNYEQECDDVLRTLQDLPHVSPETLQRARQSNTSKDHLPGALWHIFLPTDVPKLRVFLHRYHRELHGEALPSDHDPIHDQSVYLHTDLLRRLKSETGVEPCSIIQFKGDAVFIPAGAPHQVRNLHSCMKVANDFVSPENISTCLAVTKEFRGLSVSHANHEDKLQAKNMIFHCVKDAVTRIIMSQAENQDKTLPKNDDPDGGGKRIKNSIKSEDN